MPTPFTSSAEGTSPGLSVLVDGERREITDDSVTLLDALRDQLGVRSAKDGCSPQGQCGCCTVLVDGAPRVSCVTPVRRVAGRTITTVDGLSDADRARWADAFCATGASQCGFCTPGIVLRLHGLAAKGTAADDAAAVERALSAHLCRCTGWQTIVEAFGVAADATGPLPAANRDLSAAAQRAAIEGHATQVVNPDVSLGRAGFADDTAPPRGDALVAVLGADGRWVVGETLAEARARAGKVQGRRTTVEPAPPLELPPGEWMRTLRTSWVEPAYLETDASWCVPGGEPASPLANGGAFGGKAHSMAPAVARRLAHEHGRPVRVLLAREDTVRLGPKRPPVAAGVRPDGTGVIRVVATPGIDAAIAAVAPSLTVEEVEAVSGPPTSTDPRGAGWAEALVLLHSLGPADAPVVTPAGASAWARVEAGAAPADSGAAVPSIHVTVRCGDPLDEVVLRSYCIGATHMALGWVTSEAIAVDPSSGDVLDLTIRSFGVLRAQDMPHVEVTIEPDDGPPVNGSDAVFAAVASAVWRHQGFPTDWPTHNLLRH